MAPVKPPKEKTGSKASAAAKKRAAAAAAANQTPGVGGAPAPSAGGGSPADGRASRTSTTFDGLEFDSSILHWFTPEEIATEG